MVRHRKSQGAETLYTLLEQETAPRTGQEMADELENLKNIYLWNQWLEGLKDRAVIEIPGPEKG